jgi:hypothetical protein
MMDGVHLKVHLAGRAAGSMVMMIMIMTMMTTMMINEFCVSENKILIYTSYLHLQILCFAVLKLHWRRIEKQRG